MIMFFSPDCEHCQQQTRDPHEKHDKLEEYRLSWPLFSPCKKCGDFIQQYKLAKYSNVHVGRDVNISLARFTGYATPLSLPFMTRTANWLRYLKGCKNR